MPYSLNYSISGHIREQESGLGIPNLLVRAFDKDLLFDDLLGTATTDANGAFSFRYGERDFQELFDHRPDVYLSVYTAQYRFLLDTHESVRWNAGQHEVIDVLIPRAQLGPLSPQHPTDRVVDQLALDAQALTIERRGNFHVPKLPGFQTGGLPGAPALPQQIRQVALPAGGDVLQIRVMPGEPIRFNGPFNALPAQRPIPDLGLDPRTGQPLHPAVPFTLPNPRLYAQSTDPQAMVQLTRTRTLGPVQLAFVTVCPVQYESATRSYLYYPDLAYEVIFDREKADRTTEQTQRSGQLMGEWYAEAINAILDHPLTLPGPGVFWPLLQLEDTPHLIITDNFAWPSSITNPDGTTRAPTVADRQGALSGDLIAEFNRLADWRTKQGMRSQVVSITEIVSGDLGDFTQNGFARDLPEVIRNFLKHTCPKLGTTYVVLGGDVNVVPIRFIVGTLTNDSVSIIPGDANPPGKRGGYHAAGTSVGKLHADFDPQPATPLCRYQDGQVIPYNRQAGPDSLGWYYTTEDDFTKKDSQFTRLPDATPSRFVIVEGPAAALSNDYYYWVDDVNSIPTDLYYASLFGEAYGTPGKHDFDYNGNGLYGQSRWNGQAEESLDGGGLPEADIWVGRIPAESGSQVRAYVDKLITYEDLKVPGSSTAIVDPAYTKQVLFAADHWSGVGQYRQADLSVPPAENLFTHAPNAWTTHLTLSFDIALVGDVPNWTLYAVRNGERPEIHYGMSGNQTFWFFADDDSFTNQSDVPTRFVLIFGNGTTNDADNFIWYPTAIDQGMDEKETMRGLMQTFFPAFTDVHRYYADFYDLTAPPTLEKLEQAAFKKALNQGPHFVSLTGHGWWGGCCSLDALNQPDFATNRQYFIAFADSCSTARPDRPIGYDGSDSLGEVSVLDPDGGAVAYVGNTRYSWIGTGAGYEQMFWQLLSEGTAFPETTPPKPQKTARVGVAAGLRLTTGGSSFWTHCAQILYGDPALKVWTNVPGSKPHVYWKPDREWLILSVVHPGDPVMSRFNRGDLVTNVRVTLTTDNGTFFASGRTNSFGQVRLSLRDYTSRNGPLRLTVISPTSQLVSELIDMERIEKMDSMPASVGQKY